MATLRVKKVGDGFRFYARWRDGSAYVERPIGPAWVVPVGDAQEKRNAKGEPIGDTCGSYTDRKGNPADGFFSIKAATGKLDDAQAAWEEERAKKAGDLTPEQVRAAKLRERARQLEEEAARVEGDQVVTFEDAAERWYEHRRDVKRLRQSTLNDYRRALDSRILPVLGSVPLLRLSEAEIVGFRDKLAGEKKPLKKGQRKADPALSPTTINKYLVVIDGVLRQACKRSTNGGFDLPSNPARDVEKIANRTVDQTEYLSAAEIASVAAALERGAHRSTRKTADGKFSKEVNELARRADDARDAAAALVAGFAGLRRGEIVGLKWTDVRLSEDRIIVRRAIVDGEEVTPKGKKERIVPLAQPVAQALARLDLVRREHAEAADIPPALGDDAYVFGNAFGEPLDPVALTIRYRKACVAIGLREVRWHGLRHSFTTMAREGFSADQVQRIVGHEDAATAQRYSHPRSRSTDADILTRTIAAEVAASAKDADAG